MRKLSMLLLVIAALVTTSCKKEYITNEQTIPNITVVHTVAASEWAFNAGDGTYTASINMPEIDNVVFENDAVVAAAMFDNTNYESLPQVYDGLSYTYFYQPGSVTISIQGANGANGARPTGPVKFKIVMIPSAQ